jgi:hypothetical protein
VAADKLLLEDAVSGVLLEDATSYLILEYRRWFIFAGATPDDVGLDTPAGVGTDTVSGTAALTEGTDTPAGVGTDTVFGVAAITEGADTPADTATDSVSGLGAITEGTDTATAVGTGIAIVPAGRGHKRYAVRHGWRLFVYDSKAQADSARRKHKKKKVLPKPVQIIEIAPLRALAKLEKVEPQLNALLVNHDYDQVISLHAALMRVREEEEIAIALLLAA